MDKKNILVLTGSPRNKGNSDLLFVCAADEDQKNFDGIKATYREIVDYMKWEDKGFLAVPGFDEIGDIENTDALMRAEELGSSL